MKGEGEEPSSDLRLPLPCYPAHLWSFVAGHVTSLPSQVLLRPKVRVWAAELCIVPMTLLGPLAGLELPMGFHQEASGALQIPDLKPLP